MKQRTNYSEQSSDAEYQAQILKGVSRTFALTIPQLPPELCAVVSNAYLLCRIADTIEDQAALPPPQKHYFSKQFTKIVAGEDSVLEFAEKLVPLLSPNTLDAERDLVANTARVVRITHDFNDTQRPALQRCIRVMADGMSQFQRGKSLDGLEDLAQLDRYCYCVAGVVGEMLTTLFCDYSEEIMQNKEALSKLAVSFGQGLQMTNILKDIWEDRARGACWLPRDVFGAEGFDLTALKPDEFSDAFGRGLVELIGIASMHLNNALSYTLLLPRQEKKIRRFCLWAIGMAILTLRKIHRRLNFSAGHQVKISRGSVKATIAITSAFVGSDYTLRFLFDLFTRSLPSPRRYEGTVPVA